MIDNPNGASVLSCMRRAKYTLFGLGIVLLVSGFLLSRASDFPWVLRLLASDYVSASAGIDKLENLDSLSVGDEGFEELAELVASHLTYKGNRESVNSSLIKSIAYRGSQGTFATSLGPVTKMPVYVRMSGGQEVRVDLEPLREGVRGLKSEDFSFWGNLLFGLGLLSYVAEFVLDQWKPSR